MRAGHGGAGEGGILVVGIGAGDAHAGCGHIDVIAVIGKAGLVLLGVRRGYRKYLLICGGITGPLRVVIAAGGNQDNILVVGVFDGIMQKLRIGIVAQA
ncbi:hypothetical protein D3C76_1234360 [compost metagenome]